MTIPPIDMPNVTDRTKMLNILRDGLISHDTRLQNLRNDVTENTKDIDLLKATVLIGTEKELSHAERIRGLEKLAGKVERFTNAILIQTVAFLFTVISMGLAFFLKIYPVLVNLAGKP